MLETILSMAGGLLGVASGITGDVLNYKIGKDNLSLQQQNLDYQKQVQGITWNREDNAVQRRVADLKAAGLNPVLAAGTAANSGPIVSTQAPQRESITLGNKTELLNAAMNLLRMKQDISTSVAQQKYLEAQKNQSDSATRLNDIQTDIKTHDLSIYQGTGKGISSTSSGIPRTLSELMAMLNNIKGPSTLVAQAQQDLKNKVLPEGSTPRKVVDFYQKKYDESNQGTTLMKTGNWYNKQLLRVPNDKVQEYKNQGWEVVQ